MPMASIAPAYAPISTTASSPASSCDTYDYPPVDPALDAATSHPHYPPQQAYLPIEAYPEPPRLKRPFDRTSPFSSASDTTGRAQFTPAPRSATPGQYSRVQDYNGSHTAKRIKIDDLLSVGSAPPLSPPQENAMVTSAPSLSPTENLQSIYQNCFAPALDTFLETTWFSASGYQKIWQHNQLTDVMAAVFERLKMRGGSYVEEEDPAIQRGGWDEELLWAGVKLCYGTRIPISDTRPRDSGDTTPDPEAAEALRRINIIEILLSTFDSTNTPTSPAPAFPVSPAPSDDRNRFWNLLEELARFKVRSEEDHERLENLLGECHKLHEDRGNRKLLYYVAELRMVREQGRREVLRGYLMDVAKGGGEGRERRGADGMELDMEKRVAGRVVTGWGEARDNGGGEVAR